MTFLRSLNNRITFSAEAIKKRRPISPAIPAVSSWHDFFQGSQGRFAGKIGGSELLALEYSYRRLRPSFPSSMSWYRPAKRVFMESGVFPLEKAQFEKFLVTYANSVSSLDAVKLWQRERFFKDFEERLVEKLCPQAIQLGSGLMNYSSVVELADLYWLVVSPFVHTMKRQAVRMKEIHSAQRRKTGFKNFEKRCQFLECPPHSHLQPSPFRSWSEGLDRLTEKALRFQYDILIVGAGAWSLPLLANLKKEGRSGIHLGGETQLLFGIKGRRWDSHGFYNAAWVRPDKSETPPNINKIENGCYW